jgi:hypothetical protein
MYATFDSVSHPSIIYIKFSAEDPSEADFDEYLSNMTKIVTEEKRKLLIFDSSHAKYLSSDLRIKQGKWLKKHQQQLEKYIIGGAFIIPSMVIRVVFNCILAIQKLPYPHTVVSNKEDAFNWANEKIK